MPDSFGYFAKKLLTYQTDLTASAWVRNHHGSCHSCQCACEGLNASEQMIEDSLAATCHCVYAAELSK
eukprot:735196-Pleurochrysis_carterae.AAC.1